MIKRLSLLACTASALFLPVSSFAAVLTPQQSLDRAVMSVVQERRAESSAFELDVRHETKVLKKEAFSSGNEKGRVRVTFTSDAFRRSANEADGIFTLRVPQFEWESANDDPIRVQNPFTLELRVVNKVLYVRVSDVSPMLLAQLPTPSAGSPDIASFVGTWIKLDPAELMGESEFNEFSDTFNRLNPDSNMQELRALIAPGSVFQVTGVERRYKNTEGDQLMRLRVRLNPAFVDRVMVYQEAQRVKNGGMAMTAKEKATAKKELQKMLAPLKLVAVVNATDLTLDRVEGAYVETHSVYRYEYKNGKEMKYYNGKSTTDVRFGVSMRMIADRQVPVPENAVSFKTLLDQWKAANPAPEPTTTELWPEEPTTSFPITNDPLPPATPVAPVGGADHIRGNPQAPVTLLVYSDYECPFCQRHHADIQRLLTEFSQDVRVVYRNYPLSSIHPNAQVAAEAAECAGRVGGPLAFWLMHDKLFQNGTNLGTVSYSSLATQVGLNPQSFESCMNNHEGAGKVNQDVMTANDAYVNGTPATFINGSLVSGAVGYEQLRQMVMQAMGR